VVLGGGFGGLETAFTLRMLAGERAGITLVTDQKCFLFKPNSIYVPFGLDPDKLRVPLDRPTARKGIELIQAKAREIDPEAREVQLDGLAVPYDFLVVATGAGMRPAEVPGLAEHAISTWTPVDMLRLRAGFESLIEASLHNERRRVLFVIPPNNKCAGPLYEIVLMLDTWLRRKGAREGVEIVWSTFENSYIQAFGPRLHEVAAAEFERRGIEGHTDWTVERVEADAVSYANGEQLGYDLLVGFPPYIASTPFPGLRSDERGFLITDLASRRLVDHPEIFAVGDAAVMPWKPDRPVPGVAQGGIQGGRHAARTVRRRLSGEATPPFRYSNKGDVAVIGRLAGVTDIPWLGPFGRQSGFFAWSLWLLIHIVYLIGFANRLVVTVRWAWSFLTHGRGSRLITGTPLLPPIQEPEPPAAAPPPAVDELAVTDASGEPQ